MFGYLITFFVNFSINKGDLKYGTRIFNYKVFM